MRVKTQVIKATTKDGLYVVLPTVLPMVVLPISRRGELIVVCGSRI